MLQDVQVLINGASLQVSVGSKLLFSGCDCERARLRAAGTIADNFLGKSPDKKAIYDFCELTHRELGLTTRETAAVINQACRQ